MPAFVTRGLRFLVVLVVLAGPAARTEEPSAYEGPPARTASAVLEDALRKGEHHTVRETVGTARMFDVYEMESPYGLYRVTSRRLLEIRVREVETIARVVGMEGAPEGLKALGRSLAQLPSAAVQIVLHPIDSAKKVGRGLGKTWGRLKDALRGRRRSVYEDSDASNVYAGDEKRKLAADLRLDVYSTNPKVRQFLDKIANWRAAGNLTVDVASFALPVVGFVAVTTAKWRADVERLLRDKTPAELDRHNAGVLMELGIPRSTWLAFLGHPWLSPRHDTVITAALGEMKGVGNLGAVLQAATTAPSEVGALYQVQQAVLLSHLHGTDHPLRALSRVRHVVAARTTADRLVVVLPADQVYWMAGFEALVDGILATPAARGAVARRLYVTGRVTDRAKKELERRGFEVVPEYRPGA